jgi:hypothetical protein
VELARPGVLPQDDKLAGVARGDDVLGLKKWGRGWGREGCGAAAGERRGGGKWGSKKKKAAPPSPFSLFFAHLVHLGQGQLGGGAKGGGLGVAQVDVDAPAVDAA